MPIEEWEQLRCYEDHMMKKTGKTHF